ncbi:hypothetical protein PENTCL1PPCAC_27209 [Pristionchus entomophagus]|uniref:Uncharacterized protein n=1 Tax=Pristionchus entomophagus TaxID=358040 RepID=A0AAV5UFB2_9BILA|nr:hypothetical protein PENTCL1PPCAC_27209 [Pristionchus entomophagus]
MKSEDSDLVGEFSLVVLDLGSDGGGESGLDLLNLGELDEGVLVGDEDLDDVSSGLLGGGGELGNSGAGLLGGIPYLDVLSQAVELVDIVVVSVGVTEVVERGDSELLGELLLVGVNLSEDLRGEGVLDLLDLDVLLTGSLVGDEDVDDLSSGLLGGSRELGNSGAGLLGMSLKCPYLDVLSELLESGEDLVKSEDSDLVGELGLVVLNLGSHGSGETGFDLLDLRNLDESVLVGAEDLDDVASGLLGSGGQLGDSGAGLLGTV